MLSFCGSFNIKISNNIHMNDILYFVFASNAVYSLYICSAHKYIHIYIYIYIYMYINCLLYSQIMTQSLLESCNDHQTHLMQVTPSDYRSSTPSFIILASAGIAELIVTICWCHPFALSPDPQGSSRATRAEKPE